MLASIQYVNLQGSRYCFMFSFYKKLWHAENWFSK